MWAKKFLQKAQSPGIRGFGVFGSRVLLSEALALATRSMPDAGSWCIEAVHGAGPL
jgi:hypothetical protein